MNELVFKSDKGNPVTTSLLVAEKFGKEHKNVIQSIQNLVAENSAAKLYFFESEYENRGKMYPMYIMNRDGFSLLVMGFTGKQALQFKLDFIDAFNKMEQTIKTGSFAIPKSFSEALRLAAEQAETIEHQQKQLQAQAPKVLFASAVETSDKSCLVGELAKILKQNGVEIGQNRLFEWLRAKGYLCKSGESYNQPTQMAMKLGLFEIKKRTINNPNGTTLVTTTTKVTGKGQIYFVNRFLKEPVTA